MIASLAAAGVSAAAGAPGLTAMGTALSSFASGLNALAGIDMAKVETTVKGIQKLKATNASTFSAVAEGVRKSIIDATAKTIEQRKIQLVITHNDVGKTNQAIRDSLTKLGAKIDKVETNVTKISKNMALASKR